MARRVRGHTSSVSHKEWIGIADEQRSINNAIATKALGPTGLVVGIASTILRLRGYAMITLDAGAVDESSTLALGIIIVGNSAFAAGAASCPGPQSQSSDDWIWHTYLSVSSLSEAAIQPDALFARVVIDSKAMRKAKVDETVIFMAEVADSNDQAGTIDLQYAFRLLSGL